MTRISDVRLTELIELHDGLETATALRELRAYRKEGWQPIETAPQDGHQILLWWRFRRYPATGSYYVDETGAGWRCDGDQCIPKNQQDCTHWMPLPAALEPQEGP